MNKENDKKITDALFQLDLNLNKIEVKGDSVQLLFTSRVILKDIQNFLLENYFEKETLEEKLNKEV